MISIERRERLDDAKRERLMEAAIDEFNERGIESASYNKIIERSGLSKGTVYYYFDNKDSLLYTVMEEVCRRFVDAIGVLKLPETKDEYWLATWEYHERAILFFSENPSLSRIMFMLSDSFPHMDERMSAIHNQSNAFMRELIMRGQQVGAVRRDLPAETIMDLMHDAGKILSSAIVGKNIGDEPVRDEEMQQQLKQFMLMMHDLSVRILEPVTREGKFAGNA